MRNLRTEILALIKTKITYKIENMKSVLIVDATSLFIDFLKEKFSTLKIEVSVVQDKMDSIPRMVSLFPDLVIVEVHSTSEISFFAEYLQKIKADPNACRLPLIVAGPSIDKQYIALFKKLGVLQYFIKPLKFDAFFEGIFNILQISSIVDKTPSVINLHKKENLIIIEVAQGLNREKIAILRYKLASIIEKGNIDIPKIILIISNINLSFIDAINIEFLMTTILANHKIIAKNIKVLTTSKFLKDLLSGHTEYAEIETASEISSFANFIADSVTTTSITDLIEEKICTLEPNEESHAEIRFVSDENTPSRSVVKSNGFDPYLIHVAIIDDDSVICDLLSNAFRTKRIHVDNFLNCVSFMEKMTEKEYDLIILDILIPGISGIDLMKKIKSMQNTPAIFVYSQSTKKEIIAQALLLGAKQFFVKPQKPDFIVQKAIDFLNGTK